MIEVYYEDYQPSKIIFPGGTVKHASEEPDENGNYINFKQLNDYKGERIKFFRKNKTYEGIIKKAYNDKDGTGTVEYEPIEKE